MKNVALAILAIVALAAIVISGCGGSTPEPTPTPLPPTPTRTPLPTPTPVPPTPTPMGREPNYTNSAWGLSLWYPEDWIYEEQEEGVIFATSEELIDSGEFASGAAMGVLGGELQEGQALEEFLQIMLDELYFEDMQITDPQPHTIGGQSGLIVTLQGTPGGSETPVRGFISVAQRDGQGYLFIGVSTSSEWSEYEAVLQEMLASVQLEEMEHIYASSEMGLTMWYPEDWVLEEDDDQVIFATSEDVLRTGNLQAGAAMVVRSSRLRDAPLEEWFADEVMEIKFQEGGPTAKPKVRSFGGQDGLLLTFEGIPQGSEIAVSGLIAATEYEGWGYFFLGASITDDWSEYGPMLEEMLDNVQFME